MSSLEQSNFPFLDSVTKQKSASKEEDGDRPYKNNFRRTAITAKEQLETSQKMLEAGKVGEKLSIEILNKLGYKDLRKCNREQPDLTDGEGNFFEIKVSSSQRPFDVSKNQFEKFLPILERGEVVSYIFITYKNRKIRSGIGKFVASSKVSPESFDDFILDNIVSIFILDMHLIINELEKRKTRHRSLDPDASTIHLAREWLSNSLSNKKFDVSTQKITINNPHYLGKLGEREISVAIIKPKIDTPIGPNNPF